MSLRIVLTIVISYFNILNLILHIGGAFSINVRLELLEVVRPVRRVGSMYNMQPAQKWWSDGGMSAASPMPK